MYGVFSHRESVKAVASIDLCEVVRDTAIGLDEATGIRLGRRATYSETTWFDNTTAGFNYERSVVISVVRTIMDSGLIRPVEHIEAIRSVLQNWRKQGVYTVANTSTLPGCEAGTIRHTLGTNLRGCFDALVLPRNHDGKGSMTKARALELITKQADIPLQDMPFVHVDDAAHHIAGFRQHYVDASRLRLYVPAHASNQSLQDEVLCSTPFDAFLQANAYFAEEGVFEQNPR